MVSSNESSLSTDGPILGPRQQNALWAVNFYKDHDCKDFLAFFISDEAGSPQACTTMGLDQGDSYSVEWVPGFNTELRVSSNDQCSNGCCAQTYGSDYQGCRGYTQNVNPPQSWEVYRV